MPGPPLRKSALNRFHLSLLHTTVLLLTFSGCMVGPEYEQPELETPSAFLNYPEGSSIPPSISWKELFASPQLNALLQKAEASNHDLKAAWQSVVASRAIIRRTQSGRLPQIEAGLGANFYENPESVATSGAGVSGQRFDAVLEAGWELDLFGRIRRTIQAAEANAEAEEALYTDLLFTLQADVASLFFQIQLYQAEIELLQRSQETRRESLDLVQQRFETGTVSELDVAQTTSLLANAQSRLYAAMRIQNSLIYALAALVGETPATFDFSPSALSVEPPQVPAGLPGELLIRRPDLRAAERSLAAANAFIGVAKAAYFPSITLGGTAGFASRKWDDLFDSGSDLSSIRPGISLPIFQGGRLRANEEQAIALYEQQLEIYKQQVISAITEAEDLLQSVRLLDDQRNAIVRAVAASALARRISMLQYQRGLSDFITALDAERTALDAEQQFVQVKRAQYISTINLIRALGGGW